MFIIVQQLHSFACLISVNVILVFLQADNFIMFEINNYQVFILSLFFLQYNRYIFDLIKSNKIIKYIKIIFIVKSYSVIIVC